MLDSVRHVATMFDMTTATLNPLDILLGLTTEGAACKAEIDAVSASVARDRAGRERARPAHYPADGAPCSRCKGRGIIDCFRHVANGSCFACEGWGVVRGG